VTRPPLISIGIPAYNSAAHIGATLEGLLAQTCGDFELIVSDNASTDATRDVVENYRKRDARVSYERQPVNIGANPNYSHVVRRARGEFFKWSSSSDWCAPTFLEGCLNVLRAHDDTVLVAPRTFLFQDDPGKAEEYASDIEIIDDTPCARLKRLYSALALNNAVNGLIRTSALRRTRLIDTYRCADIVLMGHLALLGKFRLLEQRLLYRRMDRATATALQDAEGMWKHHYPQRSVRTLFQGCKQQLGRAWAVFSASMPAGERLCAAVHVAKLSYWDRRFLWEDVRGAWRYFLGGKWPQ
jgi:hypothetical protein